MPLTGGCREEGSSPLEAHVRLSPPAWPGLCGCFSPRTAPPSGPQLGSSGPSPASGPAQVLVPGLPLWAAPPAWTWPCVLAPLPGCPGEPGPWTFRAAPGRRATPSQRGRPSSAGLREEGQGGDAPGLAGSAPPPCAHILAPPPPTTHKLMWLPGRVLPSALLDLSCVSWGLSLRLSDLPHTPPHPRECSPTRGCEAWGWLVVPLRMLPHP